MKLFKVLHLPRDKTDCVWTKMYANSIDDLKKRFEEDESLGDFVRAIPTVKI